MFLLSLTIIIAFMVKVDKVYLSTPTKIAILDHERKRTFVLRKDGLPDAGELAMTMLFICLLVFYFYVNAYKYHHCEEIEHFIFRTGAHCNAHWYHIFFLCFPLVSVSANSNPFMGGTGSSFVTQFKKKKKKKKEIMLDV